MMRSKVWSKSPFPVKGSLYLPQNARTYTCFWGHSKRHEHRRKQEGAVKTARDEAMSLLDLVPKEQRPRSCAVITVVCVLIAVGIGVGLYFAVFSG